MDILTKHKRHLKFSLASPKKVIFENVWEHGDVNRT